MKKRYKFLIIFLLITSILSTSLFIVSLKNKNLNNETSNNHLDENLLSMMIEQTAGAGDYVKTEASSWPTDGYLFNSTLSKCENGGEVAWDSDNNTVLMMGNTSDKCYIYFDKYSLIKINNYSITSSGNSVTVTIDASSGTGTISKYYYSSDNGVTYIDSTNNTYTFSGLSKGTYNIKAYVMDSNNKSSSTVSKSIEITAISLASYIKSLYTGTQGENSLYHHDGTLTNGIDDNSYRYSGASPNNYVCFGSTDATCPTENLYRIIGVFGEQVKLIKSTAATSALLGTDGDYYGYNDTAYYWNYKQNTSINSGMGSNTWSTSLLNKTNLNTNYINNIGSTWASKIAQTTWKVGGNLLENIGSQIPSVAYQNEIVNPVTTNSTDNATEYSAKIGLMYVSDYGFAADSIAWTTIMNSYSSYKTINWMYLGYYEWTISRFAGNSYGIFHILPGGNVVNYGGGWYSGDSVMSRPSFYLTSSVTYVSGDGSASLPFRIN